MKIELTEEKFMNLNISDIQKTLLQDKKEFDKLSKLAKKYLDGYMERPFKELSHFELIALIPFVPNFEDEEKSLHFKMCLETALRIFNKAFNKSSKEMLQAVAESNEDHLNAKKIFLPVAWRVVTYEIKSRELFVMDFCCWYNNLVEGVYRRIIKFPVLCLETINDNKISYAKLKERGTFNLTKKIRNFTKFRCSCLTAGYCRRLRNSCGHPDYEIKEKYIKFKDRDTVILEVKEDEFIQYLTDLVTSISGVMCAMVIFGINKSKEIGDLIKSGQFKPEWEQLEDVMKIVGRQFDVEVTNVEKRTLKDKAYQVNVNIVLSKPDIDYWLRKTLFILRLTYEMFPNAEKIFVGSEDRGGRIIGMSMPIKTSTFRLIAEGKQSLGEFLKSNPPQYLYSICKNQ